MPPLGSSPLPPLAELPALAAFLLEGAAGRPLAPGSAVADRAVAWLARRRLAAEVARSPVLDRAGLPRAARMALHVERERTGAHARSRVETLRRCGDAFDRAGLSAMLYKGSSVVLLTHGDWSRRPMSDLDLLVRPGEREDARRALLAAGLTPSRHDSALHDVLLDESARGPGLPLGVVVEVHDDVLARPHPFAVEIADAWDRAQPSPLAGLCVPSHEDALVLSAFHLLAHERDSSKGHVTLRDLALLARAGEAASGTFAASVEARADRWGVRLMVAALGSRAVAWAGAPAWLGAPDAAAREETTRRALALRLVLRELDVSVASERDSPPRAFSADLLAALWEPRLSRCVGRLAAAAGRGGLSLRRPARLLARYAAAALRSAPASLR